MPWANGIGGDGAIVDGCAGGNFGGGGCDVKLDDVQVIEWSERDFVLFCFV